MHLRKKGHRKRAGQIRAADIDNPRPTSTEITTWLEKAGFEREPNASQADGLELEDVHDVNFLKTK